MMSLVPIRPVSGPDGLAWSRCDGRRQTSVIQHMSELFWSAPVNGASIANFRETDIGMDGLEKEPEKGVVRFGPRAISIQNGKCHYPMRNIPDVMDGNHPSARKNILKEQRFVKPIKWLASCNDHPVDWRFNAVEVACLE